MLKRLFRIAILVIILFGLYKYTSIFDNTKIKPYFERVDAIVQKRGVGVGSGSSKTSGIQDEIIEKPLSITGANNFDDADVIGSPSSYPSATGAIEEELTVIGPAPTYKDTFGALRIANCISPRGKFVPANSYIVAYEATSSAECRREKRYCNDGKLDGSFKYDTCYYSASIANQKQSGLLNAAELEAMQSDYGSFGINKDIFIGSSNSSSLSNDTIIGKEIEPGFIVSSSSQSQVNPSSSFGFYESTNKINVSNNDPNKHYLGKASKSIELLPNKQTEINNNPLKSRSLKKQLPGGGDSFGTNQKILSAKNSYEQKFCVTSRGSLLSNGQHVTAFRYTQEVNGTCELETRFCIDGTLQGSFVNPDCDGPYPQVISQVSPLDIANDALSIGYSVNKNSIETDMRAIDLISRPSPTSSEEVLHGAAGRSCYDSAFGILNHGESVIAYDSRCNAELRICDLGILDGSLNNKVCK